MNPWQKAGWRKQREQLIENASCDQCGSKEKLTIHHLHLQRNKIKQFRYGAIDVIIKNKIDCGEIIPLGKKGRLSRDQFLGIINDPRVNSLIEQSIQEAGLSEPDYNDLTLLNQLGEIRILCDRCHLAGHRHMHLCPQCKKGYTKYHLCFTCHQLLPIAPHPDPDDWAPTWRVH